MNSYYKQYYLRQEGRGLSDIGSLYNVTPFQQEGRGGIGRIFSGIFRQLRQLVSSGLSAIKEQAIKSGTAILADIDKKPLKPLSKEQGKIALDNLTQRGVNKLRKIQGRGHKRNIKGGRVRKSRNTHVKRKRKTPQLGNGKTRKKRKSSNKTKRKKSYKKARFVDIFDE